MGAWGTALYSNDTASDIRGDYVDLLRRGNSNEEALKKLMEKNRYCIGDEEEEPLFWYALADTLWNYGRLTPEVKEKALYFLDHPEAELARWEDEGGKYVEAWMRTLEKLKTKLLSPQPLEKKVSKYRLYKCTWQVGDVYAYRLESEYSKEKGLYGKYIIFQKVGETDCWRAYYSNCCGLSLDRGRNSTNGRIKEAGIFKSDSTGFIDRQNAGGMLS